MNRNEALNILGLDQTATIEDAKKAFKKMASKLHPDVNKATDAEDKFKQANEALQVLENPPERRFTPHGWPHAHQQQVSLEDLNDLFNSQFAAHTRVNLNDSAVVVPILITFEESVLGCKKDIAYKRNVHCELCEGKGFSMTPISPICSLCHGSGRSVKKASGFIINGLCEKCNGHTCIRNACTKCSHHGYVLAEATYNVQVPGGVHSGNKLRLPGAGNYYSSIGQHFNYTDALLDVTVTPHPEFKLDGNDVVSNLKISLLEALTGCTKKCQTVHGEAEVVITPGAKNKEEVSVPSHGVKQKAGAHRFVLDVVYPENTAKLIKVLEKSN